MLCVDYLNPKSAFWSFDYTSSMRVCDVVLIRAESMSFSSFVKLCRRRFSLVMRVLEPRGRRKPCERYLREREHEGRAQGAYSKRLAGKRWFTWCF